MRCGALATMSLAALVACGHATAAQPVARSSKPPRCAADADSGRRIPAWECETGERSAAPAATTAALSSEAPPTSTAAAPGEPRVQPAADESDAGFGEHVERVQELVAELGQPRWSVACTHAADALAALAQALRTLDDADRKVRRAARNTWADARGLEKACSGSFEAADLMKSGLEASLRGLERALPEASSSAPLEARLKQAQASVEALDPDTSWVFQRARVQDAFRTVSTAFAVASEQEAARDAK